MILLVCLESLASIARCIKIDDYNKNHFIYTNFKNKYPTFIIIYYYYRHNKIQIKLKKVLAF